MLTKNPHYTDQVFDKENCLWKQKSRFFTLFITARLTFGPPAAFGTASKGLLIFGPLMDVAVVTGLPEIKEKICVHCAD